MAIADVAVSTAAKEEAVTTDLSFRFVFFGLALLSVIMLAARAYQGAYAWETGLDSFHPDFHKYWMNLFYAEIIIVPLVAGCLWTWQWRTRDRHPEQMTAREEVRRIFNQFVWFSSYVFSLYWAASFFPEGDATWHQTVVRDSSLTPSHIVLFYLAFPTYIVLGIGAHLHAMTRLPHMYNLKRWSFPLLIAVLAPFLMFPNIGFNEWGHTFWVMEELFIAPLHWGFVVFAWAALAFGGITAQLISRVVEVVRQDAKPGVLKQDS